MRYVYLLLLLVIAINIFYLHSFSSVYLIINISSFFLPTCWISALSRLPWSRKQGHSSFFAAASEEQLPEFRQPSAEDIQRLLRNIGAGHRASHSAIESMIRRADARDGDESTVTADEMIDLIAQIRSL